MTKLRNIALASSIAGISFMSANAAAADAPASPHTFTSNVGLYSQYVFRGLTQTNEEPALQGGFDYAHSSGLYFGVWGSNINWLKENNTSSSTSVGGSYKTGGSLELDFYGGYKFSVGDFGFDVGLLQYYYPGDQNIASYGAHFPNADTLEAYAAVSWKWLSAKYSHSLGDTFGVRDASGTSYLDLSAAVPLGETGLTLGLHYGLQKYEGRDYANTNTATNDALYSYDDYKISLAYDLGKVSKTFTNTTIGVAYTDTSSAHACGYGAYNNSGTANGSACTGVYPKNIADGQTTVWIQRTF